MTMLAAIERAEFRLKCLQLASTLPHVHDADRLVKEAEKLTRFVTDEPKPDVQAFDVDGPDKYVLADKPNPFTVSQPGTTGGHPGPSTCETVSPEPAASEFTRPAASSFDTT